MDGNARVRQFVSWLESKIDTEGSVALVASFLLREHSGFVTKKALAQESLDGFIAVTCARMGKYRKPFVVAALYDAVAEFERGPEQGVVTKRVRVEPAMKRLERSVKTVHERGEVSTWEPIDIQHMEGSPAYVDYKVGYTANLGSYESARVAVGISIPCYPEELEDAVEFARRYVDKEVEREILKYKGVPASGEDERQLLTERESGQQIPLVESKEGGEVEVVESKEEVSEEEEVEWETKDVKDNLGF